MQQRTRSTLGMWLALALMVGLGAAALRVLERERTPPTVEKAAPAAPAVPVVLATAREGEMPEYLPGLGTVTAFNTVTVRSRVDGQLVRVRFQEGQTVRRGDLLAEIDPRSFEVRLAQAEGQLARDRAELSNANVDLARYRTLVEQDSIPRQQLDTQIATVAQYQGAIQVDEAAIDDARLQLEYCRITAPIGGRVGLRLVDAGNMVHAADTQGLLVITQVQPIAVVFTIPEDDLPALLKKLGAGERLLVEAYDRAGTDRIGTGYLLAVDNQIDPGSGTSRLKAVFSNTDEALFPNQFVNVRLRLDVREGAVIVPTVAVQHGPHGTFVYVVGADETAEAREVSLGASEGDDSSIETGLLPGERVVVEGADRLQSGSRVDEKRAETDGQAADQIVRGLRERSEPGAPPSAASLRAEDRARTKSERPLMNAAPTKGRSGRGGAPPH